MLQPVTIPWSNPTLRRTGLGWSPALWSESSRISKPSPFSTGLKGLSATTQQESAVGGSVASAIGSSIGMAVGGPALSAVVGTAINAATSIAVAIESLFQGCGQTCVQASNTANQVAALLQQNLDNYMSQPVHYASIQAACLNTFNQAWALLEQNCGNPQLGQAGQNCISQRSASGCQWKTSPAGWSQNGSGAWVYTGAGPNGSGTACWNWFVGYHDPIANDPTVVPDPVSQTVSNPDGSTTTTTVTVDPTTGVPTSTSTMAPPSILNTITSGLAGGGSTPLLLIGGGLLLLMALGD